MPADWREIIDGQIARTERRTPRRSMAVNYPDPLFALVMHAARSRDLTMTAYQRRASLSFAQWDLDFDWRAVMDQEPPVGHFSSAQARDYAGGYGYGPWHIVDLQEHDDV